MVRDVVVYMRVDEDLYLLSNLFENRITEISANERTVCLNCNAVLVTILDYRLLLTVRMKLVR